jgi:hypothetical protein
MPLISIGKSRVFDHKAVSKLKLGYRFNLPGDGEQTGGKTSDHLRSG